MVFLKCKQCGEEFEWTLNTKYFRHICDKCGQASEYNLDSSAELILESSSNEEQTTEEQTTEEQTLIQEFDEEQEEKPIFQIHWNEIMEYSKIKYVDTKDLRLHEKLDEIIKYQTTGSDNSKGLYEYQKEAYNKIIRGKDVAITAPTGSGKTFAFILPIIQRIINKGVYGKLDTVVVHPVKALSNDQFLQIKRFAEPCGITVGLLTGDTTEEDKRKLFEKTPEILCTNFDSIYAHLLHDSRFSSFFQNFNTIIVDEIHYYGGIHGSNVNHVLATLKRNNPKLQMIGASATIDNLDNYAKKFFDNKNVEIIKSNQKNGKTNFAMISPIGIPFTALLIQFCKRL